MLATTLFEGTRNLGRMTGRGFDFEVHQCGTCGVIWALEDKYLDARREDHQGWKCPNGHSFVYNGPSEREQLRDDLAEQRRRTQAARELLAAEERSHAATRGHLTRTKKRVAHGVCPCCNRTFQQLGRHMKTKHPEYVVENATS